MITISLLSFTNNSKRMETGRNFTDKELLQILRSEESPDSALRQLYRSQYTVTKAYITQNNGNDEDAADIFQEVLLTFIELVKKDKFRGDSSIATFLYAITRNTWLNELKKRGRSRVRDLKFENAKDDTEMDITHYIAQRELKTQLLQVVDTLGETCKKILLAFYYDNLAIKDILQTLQYENEQVVRNKKYKCLKQLEQLLTAQPGLANNLSSILFYE